MTLAGALADAAHDGFGSLVEKMIEASIFTHETFATVDSISLSSTEDFNSNPLTAYPDYQQYVDAFVGCVGIPSVLAGQALYNCARAAMQTPIYGDLLSTPCSAWPHLTWNENCTPDERFRHLLQPSIFQAAIQAAEIHLADSVGPLSELANIHLGRTRAAELLATTPISDIDLLWITLFEVFAEELSLWGATRPAYDEQRAGTANLIEKVQVFTNSSLNVTFRVPATIDEDVMAVVEDFRHETFVIHDGPYPAAYFEMASETPDLHLRFVHQFQGHHYVQLVALPEAKAQALYRQELSKQFPATSAKEGILTALRRRYVNIYGQAVVELLKVENPRQLKALFPDFRVLPVVSSFAIRNPRWLEVWEKVDDDIGLCFSIIDEDPFVFVSELASLQTGISLSRIHMKSPTADLPDDICVGFFTAESHPTLAFFAPSTRNRVDALALYVQSKHPKISLAEAVPSHWHEWLIPAISHSLREEGQFGSEFWR